MINLVILIISRYKHWFYIGLIKIKIVRLMIKLECQVFFNMDVQVFKVDLTPSLQEISPIACTSDIQQHPKKKL